MKSQKQSKQGSTATDTSNPNQGWSIIDIYDTRGYMTLAIVPQHPSPFATPNEAQRFVWNQAKQGDDVCRKALQAVASSELSGKSATPRKKHK